MSTPEPSTTPTPEPQPCPETLLNVVQQELASARQVQYELHRELDDLKEERDRLAADLSRLETLAGAALCCYCEEMFSYQAHGGMDKANDAAMKHEANCPKNPHIAREAEAINILGLSGDLLEVAQHRMGDFHALRAQVEDLKRNLEMAKRAIGGSMCDECDSGISEAELMDRLKDALDQRDAFRDALQKVIGAKDATAAYMANIPDGCAAEPEFLGRLVRREIAAEDAARILLNP